MADIAFTKEPHVAIVGDADSSDGTDTSLAFVQEYGGNLSKPSYQEASGAPVENISPLGLQVTWFSALFLNVGQMIGTGVFSTPASILKGVGSVGLSLLFWPLGLLIAGTQLAVYLELASYFPNRSGGEVVYLEQAYPRPRYLWPTAFAFQSVVLSFSSSNTIVMAEYLFATGDYSPTAWELKGLAVGCMTLVIAMVVFSTKWSLRISNGVGVVKILTLLLISITGLVILGGHTSVENPKGNFKNAFNGTTSSGYGLANALVKINFAYTGYANVFKVVNEVKSPVKVLKRIAPASLALIGVLYMLCNIAYFAAVPKAALLESNQLAASLFFSAAFGSARASRALNFLIALSAFGNILASNIGTSRVIRECARQGVLPYPRVWASTKPFGTPLVPYLVQYLLTILMIVAPPAGDAFNFIVDLQSYPSNMFLFGMTFGLLLIRRSRKKAGIRGIEFQAWYAAIFFSLAVNVFILVMPWFPPPGGRFGGDVTFWYGTYCVVGIAIVIGCVIYHFVWIHVLPYYRGYRIRSELLVLDDETAKVHRLVRVPFAELRAWDAVHDILGQKIDGNSAGDVKEAKTVEGKEDFA